MDHFQFSSIKLLQLKAADQPIFSFNEGSLTITATRDGATIMIKAPMKNIGEIKNGAADLILAPKPKQDKSIRQTKPRRRYTYSAAVRRGERHPFSRLTEVQVRQIKERFASPVYMKQFNSQLAAWDEIAKEYGVSMACISHIHAERTWRHVQVA